MSTTEHMPADEIAQQRDAFIDRLLQSVSGAFDIFAIYLGDRLGFYRALAESGPLTAPELASKTGAHERYAREWLEQQTISGILEVEDESREAADRRFRLPPGHSEPLVDRDSLNYLAPVARLIAGCVHPLQAVLDAYRTGAGVPYGAYGPDLREGQAAINRPAFLQQLAQEWLPAMADVQARLLASPPRASPISAAATGGRASASREATQRSMWTALTWTSPRSNRHVRTHRDSAWSIAYISTRTMRVIRHSLVNTTW